MAVNKEADRRIEAARQKSQQERDTAEFLSSLGKNTEMVKPIVSPEAAILRNKLVGAASRGELRRSDCRHPLHLIQQYKDDEPSIGRYDRDVNLFACGVCGLHLWLCTPWGEAVDDS